jgi:3-hydroxyacyl-CoA dehydrogenase/enoyl-CoA hydratase/3-hydroxybutyryl-CoA epimerase
MALNFSVDSDGVALMAIDIPGRSMNVLTPELETALAEAVTRIASDPAIKGAVLTSAKPGAFVAGADLKDFVTAYDRGLTAAQGRDRSLAYNKTMRSIETCGKPVAAAINGLALGGGLELTLCCHWRVLSDDPKAVVGLPEVNVGLLPGGGGTQRLPRLIGVPAALNLMLTGTPVKPAEALKLGIVHALAPADQLVAKAREWVLANPGALQPWDRKGFTVPGGVGPSAKFAGQAFMGGIAQIRKQSSDNLPAPLAITSAVYEGTITGFDAGIRIEAKYFGKLLSGAVARNLIRTSFINKGIADKLGRRPKEIASSKVSRLGVLGAGMMGGGIAYVAAQAGMDVVLLDSTQDAADNGKAYSVKLLAKAVQKASITQDKADAVLARISPTTDYARLAACELVVEAVFENREIKREVTQKAEAVIGASAIFASNTSTLPITGLAKASKRPAQFIGLHFFSPVDRMPLVEVIMGDETNQETLAKALDFCAQLRKTPIVVNDGPAFYTTRVFSTFIDEGACMLAEGVEPALIENAAKMAGMPVGPLAQSDEVSQELSWKIIQQARADGLGAHYTRGAVVPVLEKMMALGRKGRRFGGGFYEYPQDGSKKVLWSGLKAEFPPKSSQPEVGELRTRLLTIQALEAARCFEEGVITDPADADVGAVFGIGYPKWTGGPLSYIDTVGIAAFVADCERFALAYGARYAPSAWLKARAAKGQGFYAPLNRKVA